MHTSTEIYASFVLTVVSQEDKSRAVWPSCPAVGWSAGVDRLTARPNGNALATPDSAPVIETHGPYEWGNGFPSLNGFGPLQLFDPNTPIHVRVRAGVRYFQCLLCTHTHTHTHTPPHTHSHTP